MTSISVCRTAMRAIASLFVATLLCSCASLPADDPSLKSAKASMEGVYSLQEWHLDGAIAQAPRVDGRFVLLNGAVILSSTTDPKRLVRELLSRTAVICWTPPTFPTAAMTPRCLFKQRTESPFHISHSGMECVCSR